MPTTRSVVNRLLDTIADATRSRDARRALRLVKLLHTLVTERGESTGAVMARRAVALYNGLEEEGRSLLFDRLASEFSPDPDVVLAAATRYRDDPSPDSLAHLQRVSEPGRQEVFRRMNMAPGGTATLVGLRNHLLGRLRDRPDLRAVDDDLTHLFGSWFNRGFLELRRIDWGTPAAILEKLIAYEAVHEIRGFPDLKRRLERDRRCFAFFHPALPGEPLVFVEVAFVDEMPGVVTPLLALESAVGDPRRARCAVFYSITSCQPGLRGISFGNFLIKQVAEDLHAELPNLKQFVTLSPVPGFRAWVGEQAARSPALVPLLPLITPGGPAPGPEHDAMLSALAAHYLTLEWEGGHARDAVARFHLGNGARLERVNPRADPSAKGQRQTLGVMVNYLYALGHVERNHESYMRKHVVAASSSVERQAKEARILLGVAPGPH
jgi:malonyl-CoA decarboxylase